LLTIEALDNHNIENEKLGMILEKEPRISVLLIVSVFFVTIGVIGGIIPNSSFSKTYHLYIFTAPALEIRYNETYKANTLLSEAENIVYALIEGCDFDGNILDKDTKLARAVLNYANHNVTVYTHGRFGLVVEPYHTPKPDVSLVKNVLSYSITLKQGENQEELFDSTGDLEKFPEEYVINLLDLEKSMNLTPPYILQCDGWQKYRCASTIEETYDQWEGTFWSVEVYDNSSLAVSQYASVSSDLIREINPVASLAKSSWLAYILIGLIGLFWVHSRKMN